ncbi:MAG: hypothetical protein RLZZ387_263 [Chloroflexota bacterium]|jgi:hypothetical protein
MLTRDGSRRRSPGGVFFAHVQDVLIREGRIHDERRIFFPPANKPGAPGSGSCTAQWENRGTWMPEVREAGKATTVKVTIIGRPGRVVERPGFVLFQVNHEGPLPSLPKGLPVPSKMPATTYTVYVSGKQWRTVAEAIKAPEDTLVLEGVQWYDHEYQAIVVMATRTTTKALQRAAKQPPPAMS